MGHTISLTLSHSGDNHALEWFINKMMAIKFLRAKGGIRQTHLTPKSLSRYLVLIIIRVKRNGEDENTKVCEYITKCKPFLLTQWQPALLPGQGGRSAHHNRSALGRGCPGLYSAHPPSSFA